MTRHCSGAPIGASFDDIPVNHLILRRPRSGRLEGWAKKAGRTPALLPTLRDAALWAAPQGEVRIKVGAYEWRGPSNAPYRFARATAAFSRRLAPGTERVSSMASFTLWLMPSKQGVKIIAVGAIVATA